MTPARRVALALAVILLAAPDTARAEEEEAVAAARVAILAAARDRDPGALARALDDANALVGPSAVYPDGGALADWLAELPDGVAGLEAVRVRRAWLYLGARRGADALPLFEPIVARDPQNAVLRAYLGEARRQTGDFAGAVADFARAVADGVAPGEFVLPSVRKIVFDLRRFPPKDAPADALPPYATLVGPVLERVAMPDVRMAVVEWLDYDASHGRAPEPRAALLRAEAVRQVGALVASPAAVPAEDRARAAKLALAAAGWARSAQGAPALPEPFDLLAGAVRLAERTDGAPHDLPEALTALAEEALAKGRFALAHDLARRRLAVSESPGARRVLLALPPDVGE